MNLLRTSVACSSHLQIMSESRPSASGQVTTTYRIIGLPGLRYLVHDVMGVNTSASYSDLARIFGPYMEGRVLHNADLTAPLNTFSKVSTRNVIREQDKQAAIVLVMSPTDHADEKLMEFFRSIIDTAIGFNTLVTVALVRGDAEFPDEVKSADPYSVFRSPKMVEAKKKIATKLGIDEHAIFPVLAPLAPTVTPVHRRMALDLMGYVCTSAPHTNCQRVTGSVPRVPPTA